ncbi:16S rRNA (cytosine(967)-C(5))-methyltransferase [Psittacicella hinzii]|uniref:16S rRNA (cytosine(967)-C(5))-methyltransferase n=1 Tax=Psittacicella hinzii TaxID=2028575 RepID=A0A3A1Y3W3_9GAMM|nr:16S rRNA (cytosine(967)-C(5))-methyltransferase RsmB [Psittacicella hinzii]RIY32933.1 16S rRNA (cytosine(967)-C(5))-methyltransferase [Psittacicella hinzii]
MAEPLKLKTKTASPKGKLASEKTTSKTRSSNKFSGNKTNATKANSKKAYRNKSRDKANLDKSKQQKRNLDSEYVNTSDLSQFGLTRVKSSTFTNPRFQAALLIKRVLEDKQPLNINLSGVVKPKDIGFTSELAYGVIRNLPRINFIANKLLTKPLKKENYFSQFILLIGIYQIIYMREAHHAAVYENVELSKQLYGKGVSTIINACLRQLLRELDTYLEASKEVSLLPKWLSKTLEARVSEEKFLPMVEALNQAPPLWLRVNQDKISADKFCQLLKFAEIEYQQHPQLPQAILLTKALTIADIPGYEQGLFSVQDLHAQLSSLILTQEVQDLALSEQLSKAKNINLKEDIKEPIILDTCCSPGGKTTHLLDLIPTAKMIATDIDAGRIKRVYENLKRLKQTAQVITADARFPEQWLPQAISKVSQEQQVDLMLLDIPCSGTGVIRRHPDIKWLRTPEDVTRLAQIQLEILTKSWSYLKSGGKLLYTSCSVLGEENEQVIEKFLATVTDAKEINIKAFVQTNINSQAQIEVSHGVQLINQINGGDGFYYCLLSKI